VKQFEYKIVIDYSTEPAPGIGFKHRHKKELFWTTNRQMCYLHDMERERNTQRLTDGPFDPLATVRAAFLHHHWPRQAEY